MTQRVEWIGFDADDPWGQTPESYTSPQPCTFSARIETWHADGSADVYVERFGVMQNAVEGKTPGTFRFTSGVSASARRLLTQATSRLPEDDSMLGVAALALRACLSEGSHDALMQQLSQIIASDKHEESVRACATLAAALLVRAN